MTGRIEISIIGAYCEEYLSELFKSGIRLRSVRNENGVITATAQRTDYLKIARLSRDFGVRVRITKKTGAYYKFRHFRKKEGIIVGLVLTSIIVLTLQRFIWEINISGNEAISDNFIINQLNLNGISIGSIASDIDTELTERRILNEVDGIGWINIDINGSRIDVDISELSPNNKQSIDYKTPCNVIALKSGVILETEVYSGTLLYEKGSGVNEGSVIVSGTVNDGADNILLTHANAKIIAKFEEELEFTEYYKSIERQPTDNVIIQKELKLFGIVIPLYNEKVELENMVCKEETEAFSILGFELPWQIKTNTYTEYKEVLVERRSEDAERLAEQQLELYCLNIYDGYEILNVEKSIYRNETGVTIKATVTLKGDIAAQQIIYTK